MTLQSHNDNVSKTWIIRLRNIDVIIVLLNKNCITTILKLKVYNSEAYSINKL